MEMIKSEQIRAGLQRSFQSGTSAKASTICYGYKTTQSGGLVIDLAEANIVLFIFHRFMNGDSLGEISGALARRGIISPTGRTTWSRETISKLLSNEKYVGNVVLRKTCIIGWCHNIVEQSNFLPKKYVLMKVPMTAIWISLFFEKQIVLRASLLIRVLKVK